MPFSELSDRLVEVGQRIDAAVKRGGHGQAVRIVAVTKTHGVEAVDAAWRAGIEDVGENRVQEALQKMDQTTVPVRWHLIGHLQRNKARAASRFHMVHSIDGPRLADAVNAHAGDPGGRGRITALAQVNIAGEATKGGYGVAELQADAVRLLGLRGLEIAGVMTMAPLEADEATLRRVFSGAREAGQILREAGHQASELSMGMSNDFEIAVEEGATLVRLGTVLFGARPT